MSLLSKLKKPLFIPLLVASMLTICSGTLVLANSPSNWQNLPWVRSAAMRTANEFMTDLRNVDRVAAFEKLSPAAQEHFSDKSFNYPAAQPIFWQLEEINNDFIIKGQATFSDGIQLPVEIKLKWLDNRWKIYGVEFGRLEDYVSGKPETMPRLYFVFCCDNSGLVDKFFSIITGE